jgi:hypothetical protein
VPKARNAPDLGDNAKSVTSLGQMTRAGLHFFEREPDTAPVSSPFQEVPVSLNRTTIRALAASVAMVTAGGTVAAAAVFHIPVLGFAAAGAAPKPVERVAAVHAVAKRVAPIRVVKTRYVDEIVHHHSAAPSTPAPVAPVAARAALTPVRAASVVPPMTAPPVAQPPVSPVPGGEDGHESDDGGHGDHGSGGDAPTAGTGPSTGATLVGR